MLAEFPVIQPDGHVKHLLLPVMGEYFPMMHTSQSMFAVPFFEKPIGHFSHNSAPCFCEYSPSLHTVHSSAPVAALDLPGVQV